jgi:hypothetical protein
VHILLCQRNYFSPFNQSLVQLIRGKTIPSRIALVKKECGVKMSSVNISPMQATLSERQIEFQNPLIVYEHALKVKIHTS